MLLGEAHTHGLDRLDAQVLLAHALQWPRSALIARDQQKLPPIEVEYFRRLIRQRLDGSPVAYLTGEREFWSLKLRVTADTLIPRPETELLVETALACLPADSPARVLDLGTGSGAVALAIASERPNWEVVATDASPQALAVATANAIRLGLQRVRFERGHWWQAVAGERFDLVLSNPPYVAESDPHLSQGDLPAEPAAALRSGPRGLDALNEIVANAPDGMADGGYLLLEHGHEQRAAVLAAMTVAGLKRAGGVKDLAGRDRVCMARNGRGLVLAPGAPGLFDG